MSGSELTGLLDRGDVEGCRAFWRKAAPHLPQPETREQAEVTMHIARTAAQSVGLKARAYSHAWLLERGMPSQLPDELKPSAQRLYPVIATGVGISTNFRSPHMKGAETIVRGAMEAAVLEAEADGRLGDPAFVSRRMAEAKERTLLSLFGR